MTRGGGGRCGAVGAGGDGLVDIGPNVPQIHTEEVCTLKQKHFDFLSFIYS